MIQGVFRRLNNARKALGEKWREKFSRNFDDIVNAIENEEPTGEFERVLQDNMRLAYFEHFDASAMAQSKLLGASRVAKNVLTQGVKMAKSYQEIALERALKVLGKNQIAIDSYANMVQAEMSMTTLNEGFIVATVAEGGTHKGVVRIGRSAKPRDSHVALEGTIIPVGEKLIIDGYSVPYFHHPSLPLRHRINCKHGIVGLRLRRQGQDRGIISDFEAFFAKLQ